MKKLEILAPAGSFAHLRDAVNAGADAVYFGAAVFNARQSAVNFKEDEIIKAVEYCHKRNVKAYGTINTLVSDREIKEALNTAFTFYNAGADALILQDLGLFSLIKKSMPDIKLTASTQMAVHSLDGVKLMESLGFSRVVLARELNFEEIKYICENSEIEVEVFVHGALCMSVSGQCYFSSVIGQRSGNRGKCAQPCRLPYKINGKSGYPLSLKDLFLGNRLNELAKVGVTSVKIEGRMKSTDYVSQVTGAYCEAVKAGTFTDKSKDRLGKIFSREGFTDAYFTNNINSKMFGVRKEEDKALSKKFSDFIIYPDKPEEKIYVKAERAFFEVSADIKRKNNKASDLNKQYKFKRIFQIPKDLSKEALIWLELNEAKVNLNRLLKLLDYGYKIGISIPSFIGDLRLKDFNKALENIKRAGISQILISNIGQLNVCRDFGFEIHTDMELNVFNSFSLSLLHKLGVNTAVLSPELTFPQIRDMEKAVNSGIIAYGRLPIMTTRACIIKSSIGCQKCGYVKLTDRKNEKFTVLPDFGCINKIYNSQPLYIGDLKEYKALGLSFIRLDFTTEKEEEVLKIINMFSEGKAFDKKFTRGLYNRGV